MFLFLRTAFLFSLLTTTFFAFPGSLLAWPSDSQWLPLIKGGSPIQDNESDANGGVNVVPNNGTHPAAYLYNDGTYLFYRLRLDARPDQGGNGILAQFGWGFEIDSNQNNDDYEWLIMCDGISQPEVVALQQNTVQGSIGDPSDKAEILVASWPLPGNHRILTADTSINGNPDYFLDFRIPYDVFKAATGLTDSSLVRYYAGTSRSTNNLTDNGADLVAGSNLYQMASDFVTPFGNLPPTLTFYDGTVRFVDDLGGFNDRNLATPGDTLFIRVDDLDLNTQTLPGGTINVTVTAPTGDSERATLTATGVQGKYTGTISTSGTGGGTVNSGTLYVVGGQTATVTYVDAVAASLTQSVNRTDTILFTSAATDVEIAKSVDVPVPNEGQQVTFTVTATNNGPSALSALSVADSLPAGLTFVSATPSQGSYAGGIWTVGALAKDASATLQLRATVDAGTNGTTITNTAALTASTPPDGYAANNSASAAMRVGGTDLSVTKGVSNTTPTMGEAISYTVRILNLGPNAASGIQVRDQLPAGVTYVSHSGGGAYDPPTGVWTVGNLDSGAGALLTVTATVDSGTSGQTITNTATLLASATPDSNAANNSAGAAIRVDYTDLQLTKMAAKILPLPAGAPAKDVVANQTDTIEFTVTVRNNGPNAASGIVVTDLLPAGLTYADFTASQGSYDSGTGQWSVGALANGTTATLQLRATVDNGAAGQTLLNEAHISAAAQPDSNTSNDSDSATVVVNGTDLGLSKSVSNANPGPGDAITWTVTVTNNGPNPATGVAVTDILPAGITRTSHTASQGNWAVGGGNPSWVWTIGNLAVSASATLTIVTTVNTGTTGQTITNVAMITGADQADPNASNNVASAQIAVGGTDLSISKSVDITYPDVGQDVTYTITARNLGPNNATSVVVNDLLPPELTYQSHAADAGVYTPGTGVWSIGALNNGAPATLSIVAKVRNEDNRLIVTNTATISSATADGNSTNDIAQVDIVINGTNLAVAKTVNNSSPYAGASVVFTVTVSNTSNKQASGVQIDDLLPAGVTPVSIVSSQGNYTAGLWQLGTLDGGNSATLEMTVRVNSDTAGFIITNTATLMSDLLDQIDTNPADNSASVDITPILAPDITLVKMVQAYSDPVHGSSNPYSIPGAVMRYTIIATNSGGAAADTDSVVLTDPIPLPTDLVVTGSPVTFIDGAAASGLTFDPAADITFFDAADNPITPSADADGVDADVRKIVVKPGGTFLASDGTSHPSFSIQFYVRVR